MALVPTDHIYPAPTKAWLSAAIIFILTAIAMADRMAISMLIGPIKQEFEIGDFQASLLIGFAFMVFYILFLLPIGTVADKYSRAKVLCVCLAIWSIATVLCGFAVGFVSLFLARMLMGAGEAGIAPCSHGIIGDSFPRESLSKPLALQGIGFQIGPAVGVSAAGGILGAGAAGAFSHWPLLGELSHWRIAFILIGMPGFLALFLIPLLHEPKNKAGASMSTDGSQTKIKVLPFLKQNRLLMSLLLCGAGVSAMGAGTVMGWVPEYLQRSLGVSPALAGSTLGTIMLLTALLGQGTFSIAVDWLAGKGYSDAPIRVGLLPTLLAIPLGWFAMSANSSEAFFPWLFAFLLVVAPFNALNNTALQQIAPPELRSRLSAIMIFFISIIGFVFAPTLVGALSEHVVGEENLGLAMKWVMTIAMAVTLVFYVAAWGPLRRFREAKDQNGRLA